MMSDRIYVRKNWILKGKVSLSSVIIKKGKKKLWCSKVVVWFVLGVGLWPKLNDKILTCVLFGGYQIKEEIKYMLVYSSNINIISYLLSNAPLQHLHNILYKCYSKLFLPLSFQDLYPSLAVFYHKIIFILWDNY